MDRSDNDRRILTEYSTQQKTLAARLASIGFIWNGSIQTQWLTCGNPGCACHQDPHARHGPYVYWTTKQNGRTVSRLLHSPETEILTEWIGNRREADRILSAMKKLAQKALKVTLRVRSREANQ
jgi:hypothetical protein